MSGYNDDTAAEKPSSSGRLFLWAILLVGIAAIAFTLLFRRVMGPTHTPSKLIGQQAPEFKVEGWLNGPGPSDAELRGKVIVVDAWAFWCPPCRKAAPQLVALEREFHDRGVVFLGLTTEGEKELANSRRFIEDTGISWPNGYGAGETLAALEADFLPQVWVIDRQNRIVWDVTSKESIVAVIKRALNESP